MFTYFFSLNLVSPIIIGTLDVRQLKQAWQFAVHQLQQIVKMS
jgi:hypothetical protein